MLNRKQTILCIFLLIFEVITQDICDNTICDCSGATCLSCLNTGFFYTASQCQMCDIACKSCLSAQQCTTCSDGYYLSNSKCLQCPKYCRQCIANICTACMDGYALQSGICQSCLVSNTLTCDTQRTVLVCQSGFWKNGDSCSPCRQFCLQCTSSSNCLQCADGYKVQISAGTYCTACQIGCKHCSNTQCTQCSYNYKLVNGICQTIQNQCSLISNCQLCSFLNNAITCQKCKYPYYLSGGQCLKGASILCKNGAVGIQPYHCDMSCAANTYATSLNNKLKCLPKLWVPNSDASQIYFHASADYQQFLPKTISKFCSNKMYQNNVLSAVKADAIYSSIFDSSGQNIITIFRIFKPFYKIVVNSKYLPIYKSINSTYSITLTVQFTDNLTNMYSIMVNNTDQVCKPSYIDITSKFIKDSQVTIKFIAKLSNISMNAAQLQNKFPNGLIGYTEVLLQVYQCSTTCRICSNARYCDQCYGQYFVYNHQCVSQCFGLLEFYQPTGDPSNFKSKSCVQQCPNGYFKKNSPINNTIQICAKCIGNCSTCKSQNQCLSCKAPYVFYDINFTCLTACPSTHYSNIIKCQPCNAPCKTCQNSTKCLSCSIGFYNGTNCVGSCPAGTYSSNIQSKCIACQGFCLTCLNSGNYCLSCKQNYNLLNAQCLAACPNNTHYASSNRTCISCKSPCLECTSQTLCLSCLTGFLYINSCINKCPDGYFGNTTNQKCQQCIGNCSTCISDLICSSCVNGTYLYNSKCLLDCPNRTYQDNNEKLCIPCIQPCSNCINSTHCLSCSIGYLSAVNNTICVLQCEKGYYPNETIKECQMCDPVCQTCTTINSCLTCSSALMVLQNDKCLSQCNPAFYNDTKICRPCAFPCQTCINSPANCLTCISPYILDGITCKSQCSTNQYQKNGICLNCSYPCQSCSSQIYCSSCSIKQESKKQTYLYGTSCVQLCPDKTYPDQNILKCRTCNYPCSTCLNAQQCLSCLSGYWNPIKLTCEICPSNYYPFETNKTCILCNESLLNCQRCSSMSICKFCVAGYYLYNNVCINQSICQNISGYYADNQASVCKLCILPCGNCVSETQCSTCVTGYLFGTSCVFKCPSGYYSNSNNNQCIQCNKTICQTCVNSPINCLSCNTSSLYPVLMSDLKTCIKSEDCLKTYYLDSSFGYLRCIKCQSPCLQCKSASKCLSCVAGVLFNQSCRFSCPNGYFSEIDTNKNTVCTPCSTSCAQCFGSADFCTSCSQNKYLQNGTCVSNCSTGYYFYESTLSCLLCNNPCSTCTSAVNCTSCNDTSLILYYGQCITVCPDGTYKNATICTSCPNECQLCELNLASSSIICKSCSKGLYMSSTNNGSCLSKCENNQYADNNTRTCYICQKPCFSCFSATKCLSCISSYLIYENQCIEGVICPTNTFRHPVNPQCLDLCPLGFYADKFTGFCSNECSYSFYKEQKNRSCVSICPKNQFISTNFTCQQCNSQCENLLKMKVQQKSIFNQLFLKLSFTKTVDLETINQSNTRIQIKPLAINPSQGRLLMNDTYFLLFVVAQIDQNAIWLKIITNQTIKNVQLTVTLDNPYIFQGQIVQNSNATIFLSQFDKYSQQEKQDGKIFEKIANIISIIMIVLFLVNFITNTISLIYPMLDYFQLLFMFAFIYIDYPPPLNNYLYGYRFSHYTFIPQIFNDDNYRQQTPGKFGVIVPDVNFLKNTGHDFIIGFVAIGILGLIKLVDVIVTCRLKSTRVVNNQNAEEMMTLSQQIRENKHGYLIKGLKGFVNRIKWNYFNDIIYAIYFYVILFSFSQTYDFSGGKALYYASNFFSILFIILGIILPIFYSVLLKLKQRQIQESTEILDQYKCFYYLMKPTSPFVTLWIPLMYVKKLIFAILLVYASEYSSFILAIAIMSNVIFVILLIAYRPYKLFFHLIAVCIFELLFCCGIFCILIMQLEYLDFTPQQKIKIGLASIIITIILAVIITLYNLVIVIAQILNFFCNKDCFQNHYEVQQSDEQTKGQQQSDSNIRLQFQQNKPKQIKLEAKSDAQSSDFDIYLKKDSSAPPLLIKCLKNYKRQESQNQQQPEEQQSQNNDIQVSRQQQKEELEVESREDQSNEQQQQLPVIPLKIDQIIEDEQA